MPTLSYTKSGGNFTYVTTSGTSTITGSTTIRYTTTNDNGSWVRVHIPVPVGHIYTITQIYTEYTSAVGTSSTKGEFQYGIIKEKRNVYDYDKNSSFTYTAARGTYGSSAGNTYTASTSFSLDSGDWYLYVFVVKSGYSFQYITTNNTKLQLTYTDTALPTYTISYNANGGSGAPASQTKIEDITLTLSSTKPTKANTTNTVTGSFNITGDANGGYFGTTTTTTTKITASTSHTDTVKYTFSKWNTVSDGSGTSYAAGANYTANATATLYAQYTSSTTTGTTTYSNNSIGGLTKPSRDKATQATYTITYVYGNGSSNSTATCKKIRTYSFNGWSEAKGGTVLSNSTTYTSAKTVYASWGETDSTESTILPTPIKTGYTFMGWSTNQNATSGTIGSYTPSESVTLYAIWKANGAVRIYVDGQGYKMAQVYLFTTSDNKWHLTIPYLYDNSWHISS